MILITPPARRAKNAKLATSVVTQEPSLDKRPNQPTANSTPVAMIPATKQIHCALDSALTALNASSTAAGNERFPPVGLAWLIMSMRSKAKKAVGFEQF